MFLMSDSLMCGLLY